MHEASIVESLIDLVRERVPPRVEVKRVHIRVGLLTGVSPDCLQFYFEFFRTSAAMEGAELTVEMVPLEARCPQCLRHFVMDEPAWSCPGCGAPLSFANGNELDLMSVEVEDGARDLNSREDPAQKQ